MPETATAPGQPSPTAADPKQTAANIVRGIQEKSNGKAPAAPAQPPITGEQKPPTEPTNDPNAGKEKYVVEGKEVWLTPEQAKAYVQKGLAFEPRMDQLARLAQEQQMFMRSLLTDPGKVLAGLAQRNNIPLKNIVNSVLASNASDEVKDAVGEWFYHNAVEPLKLSPEELKARENEKKLTEYEKREKDRQADVLRQENMARVERAMAELKGFISEAMKESGLPNNDTPLGAEMARMVADVMRVARYQKQNVTPKQAIDHVKRRIQAVQAAYYDHLEPEALVKELGEKNAEKVKQYFLKLAQGNGGKPPVVPKGKAAARNERKTMSMDDFHDYLDGLKKQG